MPSDTAPGETVRGKRHVRGLGNVYQRGAKWWIRYWHRGQCLRESAGDTQRAAEGLLKKRLQDLGRSPLVNPTAEARVTMADLFDGLVTSYRNNGLRSLDTLEYRLAPLRDEFGRDRASDVTASRVEAYKADRLADRKRPATVNRELAALRRAFRLAIEQERINHAPRIKLLEEHNTREGFLTPDVFEMVAAKLPDYLRDAARFAYLSGWRRGELQSLAWSDVDRGAGLITLRRIHSKNGEPRVLPLSGDLAALIERRWLAREIKSDDGKVVALASLVFHRSGMPLGDFRKSWRAACKAAGAVGTLFHDLRRSAVRNLERAGVSQAVAMRISGHKTASVYRRYRIVNESDLREALERMQAANGVASPSGRVAVLRAESR